MNQNNIFTFFYLGFGIVVIAVIVVLAIRSAKQRTRDMAEAAERFGFQFLGHHWRGPVLSNHFAGFLLQRTHGSFSNVMTGSSGGLQVSIFDYSYGQGKSTVTQTVACFSQDVELPPFELRPENVLDRIGDAFVHNDIDFASNPEFSKRYRLRSPDEARARSLFTSSLLTYMEQLPPDNKWHIEAAATILLVYRGGRLVKPADLPWLLNQTSAIARAVSAAAKV